MKYKTIWDLVKAYWKWEITLEEWEKIMREWIEKVAKEIKFK